MHNCTKVYLFIVFPLFSLLQVQEIDPERQRFIVSLRPSDCFPEETEDNALELLKTYLVERQQIIEHLSSTSGSYSS